MYIGQVLKEFFQMPRPTSPPAFPMEPNFKVCRQSYHLFLTHFRLNSDSHRLTQSQALPLLSEHSSLFVVLKTPFFPSLSFLLPLSPPGWLFPASTKVNLFAEVFIIFSRHALDPRHSRRSSHNRDLPLLRLATSQRSRPLYSNRSLLTNHLPRF